MAEGDAEPAENKGRGLFRGGATNILKTVGKSLGLRFKYYKTDEKELPVRKRLQPQISLLKARMKQLDTTEGDFKKAESFMAKIADAYAELGPYTSVEICSFFKNYYSKGWLIDPDAGATIANTHTDEYTLKINRTGSTPLDTQIKWPKAREVMLPDGYIEGGLVVFGYSSISMWSKYYTDRFDSIISHFETQFAGHPNLIERLKGVRDTYKNILQNKIVTGAKAKDDLSGIEGESNFESLFGRDKRMEGWFSDTALSGFLLAKIKKFRSELFKDPVPGNFHTYKVVKPIIFNVDGSVREALDDGTGRWTTISGGPHRDREVGPGLDKYGMPLEVFKHTDGTYRVLIDKLDFPDELAQWRTIPDCAPVTGQPNRSFVEDLPLYLTAAYVANEWDAFRDDLRDGRFHGDSITTMEYIMAEIPALGDEWKTKRTSEIRYPELMRSPRKRGYKMNLTADNGTKFSIYGERKPSQISPAFDIRAKSNAFAGGRTWTHIGRKYYHEDANGIGEWEVHKRLSNGTFAWISAEQVPHAVRGESDVTKLKGDPHMSSRGLSMYIIDHICREGKSLAEIQTDLKEIAKETSGFDYGPRTMGGAPTFNKDPFNIDVAAIIKSIKGEE
jgi:hypothetical protein